MPSGSAIRCSPGATSVTMSVTAERSRPCPGSATPGGSLLDLGDRAQLVRRRGSEAEELQIRRDLFEEHLLADLDRTPLGLRLAEERRDLLLHHDLADEGARVDPVDVHRQRVVVLHP